MPKHRKQVSLGYNDEGKRIRKWVSADSKQELRRKEREILKNADAELQSSITFGVFAQQWYDAYKKSKSKATQNLYSYALRQLEPLNRKRIKDITRTDVQKIINTFADRPHSAHAIFMTASQILDVAAADGLITPKYLKLELPKKVRREKRALTAEEKKAVKAAKLNAQERLFVDIEFYLGLRPEETRALQPRDFDLKKRTVTISRASALHGNAIIKETKTGRTRTIPVPDVLIAEIKRYNASFSGFYYFVDESGTLFSSWRYHRFCESIFAKINTALGGADKLSLLNGMTMYTFRHNRATELYYLDGVSTKKKAEYMGHSELMFLKTYSHLDDEKEETELLRKVAD
jgi:integrase